MDWLVCLRLGHRFARLRLYCLRCRRSSQAGGEGGLFRDRVWVWAGRVGVFLSSRRKTASEASFFVLYSLAHLLARKATVCFGAAGFHRPEGGGREGGRESAGDQRRPHRFVT